MFYYRAHTKGAKAKSVKLWKEGRVNFTAPAIYEEGSDIDQIVKATMEKVSADQYLRRFTP
jgi:hypothetical protein